ncbi:glycoside hydrolase family 28 protein [Leifsonia xyli]|uniref:glycoside hydrolase family 28 protein n=1 Tax=Leifsonia xyli TaxID=1575 RepID=UPI0002D7FAA3|nr:glycosyl hydrolase family 28 protein [Leifsonia xyli]
MAATPTTSTVAAGDRRDVTEPSAPDTVCATVTARLSMPGGKASDAGEASPPDTARIQHALDACAQKGTDVVAVRLSPTPDAAAFLSGPLTVREGEVLLVDAGVVLYASRNPADYQVDDHPACGTISKKGGGCAPFVTLAGAHSGIESVPAADRSQGRIDGRGGSTMLGAARSWWGLAAAAKGHGTQNVPRLIQARGVDDVVLHDVDLVDAPGFHVSYQNGDGLTVWGVRIQTPAAARNTDGIDPAGAQDVTIADSWIMDGDDGIAIKALSAPSAHISVIRDHFFGTHGISIGSETEAGVSDVFVSDVTVSGTDAFGNVSASSAGIRIKSSPKAGGLVQQVTYRNVCVDAVKAPIQFDPNYANRTGSTVPWFTDIVIDGFRSSNSPTNAESMLKGLDEAHPLALTMSNAVVDARHVTVALATISASGVTFGGLPLAVNRPGVDVTITPGQPNAPTCTLPTYPAP